MPVAPVLNDTSPVLDSKVARDSKGPEITGTNTLPGAGLKGSPTRDDRNTAADSSDATDATDSETDDSSTASSRSSSDGTDATDSTDSTDSSSDDASQVGGFII